MHKLLIVGFIWIQMFTPDVFAQCNQKPLLFQIKTTAGSVTLFGTYHLAVGLKDFPQLDLSDFSDITVESSMHDKVLFFDLKYNRHEMSQTNRPSILNVLTPQEVLQLRGFIDEAWHIPNVHKDYLYFLNPFVGQLIVRNAWMARHKQTSTLDMEIQHESETRGITVHALEDFNLVLLSIAPAWKDHVAELKALLPNPKLMADSQQAYCEGNVQAIESSLEEYKNSFPDAYSRLFTARNQAWLPQLIKLSKTPGDHLVAVGANHLLGNDGLLQILKRNGLPAKRIGFRLH
jgi:uncharacterized protein YbaP (TraB family)